MTKQPSSSSENPDLEIVGTFVVLLVVIDTFTLFPVIGWFLAYLVLYVVWGRLSQNGRFILIQSMISMVMISIFVIANWTSGIGLSQYVYGILLGQ